MTYDIVVTLAVVFVAAEGARRGMNWFFSSERVTARALRTWMDSK